MSKYVTVSFSGGKDSTAMLLHMIELGEHIDEVINVDTGMEFPAMYDHIARVRRIVEEHGIKYTALKNPLGFEHLMIDKTIVSKKYGEYKGFGWPTMQARWCTKHLKVKLLDKHVKELSEGHELQQCIGLAADEYKRLDRINNTQEHHRHPLVEWGWSEADCLAYCKSLGYDWGGLYDLFNRASCWCCPLQSITELRKLWANYPDLWARLEDMERRLIEARGGPMVVNFKGDRTVVDFRHRFEREAKAQREQTTLDIFEEADA